MAHFTTPRPVPQAKPIPLTEEEKRQQIAQILMQKREQFAINILCNMVQGWNCVSSDHETALDLVDTSVKMADALMEKLYPIQEDNNGKQD